jgi:hypothetical protein
MVLSGFQPVKVLKNMKDVSRGSGGGWLRQGWWLFNLEFQYS